ncbi:putative ferric-chelate reductase 1 isoform X2 [Colossoma macropomum]|uniref:putative ferric-chelate reductase 1 isoform X2 n=1 Tax=Colossoma macropomum TaxID=42526 RepID=UPI0018655D68|nr:putative ferric-chelate reductase 1 isoform X2 [Colossoma macropomum]
MQPLFLLLICVWVVRGSTAMSISSAGCGIEKVCFNQPADCDPAADPTCYFMSVMSSPNTSAITIELQGQANGYISFGFSDDQLMGNDDIYICGTDGNGTVQVQRAFSTGRGRPTILSLGNVSDITASMMDGVISCSFISQNPISTVRASEQNSTYFLLFAYGSSSDGLIQYHGSNTFVSSSRVDIFNPQILASAPRHQIIKAHGSLMLIAWMTTASLGMISARYLKAVTKGRGCCGKDFWFLAHVSLMSLSVVMTAASFILVFVHKRSWSGGAHPVLGCIVMILSLIQPIVAAFRCAPQHERRFIFNWLHALNAVVIKVLAVAAIFTGLLLFDDSRIQWLVKVMGAFVGWEVLFYIIQDAYKWLRRKGEDEPAVELVGTEIILVVLFFLGNLAFLLALLIGIGTA